MTTQFYKGRDGWQGETREPLGITRTDHLKRELTLELEITTRKSIRGGVHCSASVFRIGDRLRTHTFGLGAGGDFSKNLEEDRAARCTEKTVKAMHERAVAKLADLVEEAKAYYAKGADAEAA